MASLSSQPNAWNLAYNPNIFTLGALGADDQFGIKVYSPDISSGNIIATYKQSANPAGVAHFNVSKILESQLQPSYTEWNTLLGETPLAAVTYQVAIGHYTNNVWFQDGASAIKIAVNGYSGWRVKDWDYVDYIPEPDAVECLCEGIDCIPFNAEYTRTYEWLTNFPITNNDGDKKYNVRSDEWKTLSFVPRILNWNDGTIWGPNESAFFVKYTYYNSAGVVAAIDIKTISDGNGLSIRTDCQDMSTHNYADAQLIATIGVGPQNIKDSIVYFPPAVASYKVEIYSFASCYANDNGPISDCDDVGELIDYLGDKIYGAEFIINDSCQKFDPITISFLNAFGVVDYFTANKRNTYTSSITRNNFKQQLGSWSSSTWNIAETGRGRRTFSTMATTQMTLTSDWMTDAESIWLEELFTSPHANIYINGAWEPVVILSTEYQQMTSARNGLFQHEITVQFANDKNIQRG